MNFFLSFRSAHSGNDEKWVGNKAVTGYSSSDAHQRGLSVVTFQDAVILWQPVIHARKSSIIATNMLLLLLC